MNKTLPTLQECYALWDKYQMPENIRAHTRAVARVADAVAAHLIGQGIAVDKELVNRGALLHDIAKLRGIQGGKNMRHTEEGGTIVLQEGLPARLADVVRHHGTEAFSFDLPIEEQIVNYADRRVVHDKVVSLDERLLDLRVRYPHAARAIEAKRPLYGEFENRHGADMGQVNERLNTMPQDESEDLYVFVLQKISEAKKGYRENLSAKAKN